MLRCNQRTNVWFVICKFEKLFKFHLYVIKFSKSLNKDNYQNQKKEWH